MNTANDILDYWFGQGPLDSARLTERSRFWFGGDGPEAAAARDAQIRAKLEPLLARAAAGELDAWAASPRRRLALILLFDQVPRNIYRKTPQAWAFDARALALAVEGLQLAADQALEPVERVFFYLPLEHAESLETQDLSVDAFTRLAEGAPPELRGFLEFTRKFAAGHRDVIRQFGRFPYRNAVLGRESTAAEKVWVPGEFSGG
jgi:uncharacterized protein (DUF924 family)